LKEQLTRIELINLVKSVFSLQPEDKNLAILVDLPDGTILDNEKWKARRAIAYNWFKGLKQSKSDLNLKAVSLVAYNNVHSNNADLPETVYLVTDPVSGMKSEMLSSLGNAHPLKDILSEYQILFAPTEFSATAPLKLLSKELGFRAATMPGFSEDMIPALRLDYEEVNRQVFIIKRELDKAVGMDIQFTVKRNKTYKIHFDLRFRTAHASGGRFPEPGTAGNLPSGESYIVPYEGENEAESESRGILPVQFEDEIVLYKIEKNKAVDILSKGKYSDIEKEKITTEPAYSNIAELGFGVLKDFGCRPTGSILLDEKLGLHIAFGRSDHFGGAVGVKDFSSSEKVVHIDRIYIPETQPDVYVNQVILEFEDEKQKTLMKDGVYTIF
jgi:hypothetical protein